MEPTKARNMLQRIVFDTVTLDLQMQQQKASFCLFTTSEFTTRAPNRLQYEPTTMEIRYGKVTSSNRPQNISLLIAPLLVKFGTSDGTDYGTYLVIEKAHVDIEVLK